MITLAYLYDKFCISRRKPTTVHFRALIDSCFNKEVTIDDVADLRNTLNQISSAPPPIYLALGEPSYTVPAGGMWIEKFFFNNPIDINITLGLTAGGSELTPDTPIEIRGGKGSYAGDLYFPEPTTIYFTGRTANTQIIIKRI